MNIITSYQLSEALAGGLFFLIYFIIYRFSFLTLPSITDIFFTTISIGFIIWIGKICATYVVNNY